MLIKVVVVVVVTLEQTNINGFFFFLSLRFITHFVQKVKPIPFGTPESSLISMKWFTSQKYFTNAGYKKIYTAGTCNTAADGRAYFCVPDGPVRL